MSVARMSGLPYFISQSLRAVPPVSKGSQFFQVLVGLLPYVEPGVLPDARHHASHAVDNISSMTKLLQPSRTCLGHRDEAAIKMHPNKGG